VTLITILLGTHALWRHNTTNRSFNFSHIIAATRTVIFEDALKDANRHHIPHKVMEQCGKLRFGIIDEGKEVFTQTMDADGDDGCCGCLPCFNNNSGELPVLFANWLPISKTHNRLNLFFNRLSTVPTIPCNHFL
jgi:hypothetical protein